MEQWARQTFAKYIHFFSYTSTYLIWDATKYRGGVKSPQRLAGPLHRFFKHGSLKRATLGIHEETSAVTCVAVTNWQTLPSNLMFSVSVLFKLLPWILDAAAIDRVEAKLELVQMQQLVGDLHLCRGWPTDPRQLRRKPPAPRRQTWAQRGLPAAGSCGEAAQRGACARKHGHKRMRKHRRPKKSGWQQISGEGWPWRPLHAWQSSSTVTLSTTDLSMTTGKIVWYPIWKNWINSNLRAQHPFDLDFVVCESKVFKFLGWIWKLSSQIYVLFCRIMSWQAFSHFLTVLSKESLHNFIKRVCVCVCVGGGGGQRPFLLLKLAQK